MALDYFVPWHALADTVTLARSGCQRAPTTGRTLAGGVPSCNSARGVIPLEQDVNQAGEKSFLLGVSSCFHEAYFIKGSRFRPPDQGLKLDGSLAPDLKPNP